MKRKLTIPFLGNIYLHDLECRGLGKVEHDDPLAQADADLHAIFASMSPDQALLEDMLAEAPKDQFDRG